MKNKTVILILSSMALMLTGILTYYLINYKVRNVELIESYHYSDVEGIYISAFSTDITIEKSSTDEVIVEYYSNQENNPEAIFEDNKIILNENNSKFVCFGICNIKRKIILYLPTDYTGIVDISTMSGDIKSNVALHTGKISTLSGDVILKDIDAFEISTKSGDIDIATINDKIDISTLSGDVSISHLKIQNVSSITTMSGDVSIRNNDSAYITIKTTTGDVKLDNNIKDGIDCNIKTTSGDIDVY